MKFTTAELVDPNGLCAATHVEAMLEDGNKLMVRSNSPGRAPGWMSVTSKAVTPAVSPFRGV